MLLLLKFFLSFQAILQFANYMTYGRILTEKDMEHLLLLDEDTFTLNQFDSEIMYMFERGYTAPLPLSFLNPLCKYYINDVGQVPRWSKLHKKIERCFRELAKK